MLQVISTQEAIALASKAANGANRRTETLPIEEIAGRVAAQEIRCRETIPAFSRSTMDGYAVRAADVFGAGEGLPTDLRIIGGVRMGQATALSLGPGETARIPTGGMLPAGADAVVPYEYTEEDGFGVCLVYRPVHPGENVTGAGDDAKDGQTLICEGTVLTPAAAGVLAAAGIEACSVYRKPRVGIFSTGNEIVPVEKAPLPGQVRDVNTALLSALSRSFGCSVRTYGIVPDDEGALTDTLRAAVKENDLVLLSGGSSAGKLDLTAKVIAALGTVLAHGVAMKPGKPTVIGAVGQVPVFGLPGHPAACYFAAKTIVKPCVETLRGAPLPEKTCEAVLTENISSNHGREEFLCVKLNGSEATPVYGKSGVISQLLAANGYLRIPRDCEGLKKGSAVTVYLI